MVSEGIKESHDRANYLPLLDSDTCDPQLDNNHPLGVDFSVSNYNNNLSYQLGLNERGLKFEDNPNFKMDLCEDGNKNYRKERTPTKNSNGNSSRSWSTPRLFPSYRLYVALMTSLAMFLGYALLTNFSVAIVKMAYQKPTTIEGSTSCIAYVVRYLFINCFQQRL